MASSSQRFYEEDEAEQILNLAASISSPIGKMSHDRLLQTAEELGISAEAVEQAERQIESSKQDHLLREQFYGLQKKAFLANACSYVAIMGFLAVYSFNRSGWPQWVVLLILGWGIGVVAQARVALFRKNQSHEDAYQKWLHRGSDSEEAGQTAQVYSPQAPKIVVGVHIGSGQHSRLRKLRAENRDSSET